MASTVPEEPPHLLIMENIMEWGEEQEDIIISAWTSPGGWEGWTQVELHRALDYYVTREDDAYAMLPGKKAKRTDLAFQDGPFVMGKSWLNHPQECVLIELKCEGAKNRANFKDGVRKDIEKIRGDIKKQWWGEGGCTVYSIALSMSSYGHREMQDLNMRRYHEQSEHDPPFQLWWTMRQISPDHFSNPDLTHEQAVFYTKKDKKYAGPSGEPIGPVSYDEDDLVDKSSDDAINEDQDGSPSEGEGEGQNNAINEDEDGSSSAGEGGSISGNNEDDSMGESEHYPGDDQDQFDGGDYADAYYEY